MAGEAALGISIYAAAEASMAKHEAELAETRAFVNGYSHHSATPEERQRYVESIKVLYPHPSPPRNKEMDAIAARCFGGFIVACFLIVGGGAAVGKWFYGDAESGACVGFTAIMLTLSIGLLGGIFCFGVALLFGGIG